MLYLMFLSMSRSEATLIFNAFRPAAAADASILEQRYQLAVVQVAPSFDLGFLRFKVYAFFNLLGSAQSDVADSLLPDLPLGKCICFVWRDCICCNVFRLSRWAAPQGIAHFGVCGRSVEALPKGTLFSAVALDLLSFAPGNGGVCATAQRTHYGKCTMTSGSIYRMCTSNRQHVPLRPRRRLLLPNQAATCPDLLACGLMSVATCAWNAMTPIACAPSQSDELCVLVVWPLL